MKSKQFGRLAVIVAAMALFLAACGAEPTATPTLGPTAAPLPQSTPTPTPDAATRFQAEWDALITAAKDEGSLTVAFGGGTSRWFRPIAEFFGEKFGIDVVITVGGGSAQVNRLLAEQNAGRYLVDSLHVGPTSSGRLIPAGRAHPIADLFIHPEVTDKSLWYEGKHYYSDPEQKFNFAFAADADPQNMGMRYNTDLVTQEDIGAMNSVFDFLDPKWKGKIVSRVPVAGGSIGRYYTAYVHPDIGPSWIDGFLSPELDVTFLSDNTQIVNGVAKGKFAMGIAMGASGRDLDALESLGAPVKRLVKEFKEGGELSASGGLHHITVPINQPHPNAAKLWVNWWLSKEGQTAILTMSTAEVAPTLRVDVPEWGTTTEYTRRVEGKTYYFFGTDPEYVGRRQEAQDYVTTAYTATR